MKNIKPRYLTVDIYRFGSFVSGANSICFMRSQEIRTLATCFIPAMEENRQNERIDVLINWRKVTAKLARKCVNLKRDFITMLQLHS